MPCNDIYKNRMKGFILLKTLIDKSLKCSVIGISAKKFLSGFTLVELLVALGLFVIVMTISSSILISTIRMTHVVASQARAMDNISLALEQMAREIRMGSNISAIEGSRGISFRSYDGSTAIYSFCARSICRNNLPITDGDILIRGSFFIQTFGGTKTPRITVTAQAEDTRGNVFGTVQTTVSARLIHYKPI